MLEETRGEKLQELKRMRAELLEIKEQIESGESGEEASKASLATIKEWYTSEFAEGNIQKINFDESKSEDYSQYYTEGQTHNGETYKNSGGGLRR